MTSAEGQIALILKNKSVCHFGFQNGSTIEQFPFFVIHSSQTVWGQKPSRYPLVFPITPTMASLPTAAAIANVTKTASNRRFFFFSSSLAHNFNHYRPFFAVRPTFSSFTPPVGKDNVATRGRICRNGARFPFSFCTTASTSDAAIASSSTSLDKDDDPEKKIKDAADTLDIRVGRIIKAWRHQEADSLYVEEVDVGEPEPRLICSGLVRYIPLDQLQVLKFSFLKEKCLRGHGSKRNSPLFYCYSCQ